MGRKLLFFDIDETLMDGRTQKIPGSAIEGIRMAHDKGNLIFINTGRPKSLLPQCLEDIPIDGYSYSCGSHIEYRGEVLFEKFVPADRVTFIRDAMIRFRLQGIFQGPNFCYFGEELAALAPEGEKGACGNVFQTIKGPVQIKRTDKSGCYENFRRFLKMYDRDYKAEYRSFYEVAMEVNKLVTFWTEESDYEGFLKALGGTCQLIENGGGFTEILPLSYTKASCMDFLMEYFHIDAKDCYVFGDSPNDLPMLTHTANSIAMGNGYEEVKALADYVARDIDKDGVYEALKHFSII